MGEYWREKAPCLVEEVQQESLHHVVDQQAKWKTLRDVGENKACMACIFSENLIRRL